MQDKTKEQVFKNCCETLKEFDPKGTLVVAFESGDEGISALYGDGETVAIMISNLILHLVDDCPSLIDCVLLGLFKGTTDKYPSDHDVELLRRTTQLTGTYKKILEKEEEESNDSKN